MDLTSLDIREFATEAIYRRCDVVVRLGDYRSCSTRRCLFCPFHFAGYAAGQTRLPEFPDRKLVSMLSGIPLSLMC